MTSKTSRPTSTYEAHGQDLTPWSFLADLSRQQLSFATESVSAIFRSSEAMRKVQQQAAHQASEHYAAAAQKLRGASQPADLMAIQSELLRFDLQESSQYWQQLMTAALQAQTEMMTTASHILDSDSGSGVKSALEAMQAAIPPIANSFFVSRPNGPTERAQASS
ncbi:MAG: phasin family protein [Burkholderiaceae bacterium]|nr:phasin family protein [Burkholderiaceae bacterium]